MQQAETARYLLQATTDLPFSTNIDDNEPVLCTGLATRAKRRLAIAKLLDSNRRSTYPANQIGTIKFLTNNMPKNNLPEHKAAR
ncbi:MAG: hypothetical protein OSB19_06165 [Opitutaceae bacterium]|nr:hypothetical protein [Opitutaceae bacterium]